MLTGYNSDLLHQGLVLHVQTEDKGEAVRAFESVVYVGGQVVAVERHSYADALSEGATPEELSRLMDGHHQRVIGAVKEGRFDERLAELTDGEEVVATVPPVTGDSVDEETTAAVSRLAQELLEDADGDTGELELVPEQPLDAVPGGAVQVRLRLRSAPGHPVGGLAVSAELISVAERPQVLAEAVTDDDGLVELRFDLPHMATGPSALIFTAESDDLGVAEFTHLL